MIKNIIFFFINLLLLSTSVHAIEYPNKEVKIYIPFSTGGASDQLTRLITTELEKKFNQKFTVIANNTDISPTAFMNNLSLRNDGHEFVVGNLGTHVSATFLEDTKIIYDPVKDFIPVAMLGITPMYLVLRPDFPADNFKDFLEVIRTEPNSDSNISPTSNPIKNEKLHQKRKLISNTVAHAGLASTSYITTLFFQSITKAKLNFVEYNGSKPALNDVANGYIDFMFDQSTSAMSFIKSGQVKSFLTTAPEGLPAYPNILTYNEVGLQEFNLTGWNMLFAPQGTDKELIKIMNKAIVQIISRPNIRYTIMQSDTIIEEKEKNIPSKLLQFLQNEIAYWKNIIKIIDISNRD